jgi:hypothetical protein
MGEVNEAASDITEQSYNSTRLQMRMLQVRRINLALGHVGAKRYPQNIYSRCSERAPII